MSAGSEDVPDPLEMDYVSFSIWKRQFADLETAREWLTSYIAAHTQAAVAGMRAERDAALKANGEPATLLDIGPMSEAARQALQTRLTTSESEVAGLREALEAVQTRLMAMPDATPHRGLKQDIWSLWTDACDTIKAALRPAHTQTKGTP